MRYFHPLAALLTLAAVALVAPRAAAMYHPATGHFLQRDPGPDGIMAVPRLRGGGLGVEGTFSPEGPTGQHANRGSSRQDELPADRTRYPDEQGGYLVNRDPYGFEEFLRARQAGPGGQYNNGMGLCQYATSNPVRFIDPRGTDIYLKTGNNTGNALNDAIHQNVCVDTWDATGCRKTGIACF